MTPVPDIDQNGYTRNTTGTTDPPGSFASPRIPETIALKLTVVGQGTDRKCSDCDGQVDADGVTTSACGGSGSGDECGECFACVCDMSC